MLRPLALLALTAAAAQAHTLEFQLGTSRPSTTTGQPGYNSNVVTGLSYSNQVSNQVSVGATLAQRDIEPRAGLVGGWAGDQVTTLTLDLTWELGSRDGGLKPFFAVGAGATRLDEQAGSSTALTGTAQAGLRFEISEDVDVSVAMRHFRIFDVNFPTLGEEDIRGWETYLGLRLKF